MAMSDSILSSVKKLIGGLTDDYDVFDEQLILYINTAFATLTEMGVGPDNGFYISGYEESWTDFMDEGVTLNLVKTYVGKKVQFLFDPPTSGALQQALERALTEYEWRCYISCDPGRKGVY